MKSIRFQFTLLTKFDKIAVSLLSTSLSFKIYSSVKQLPVEWDDLAVTNIFLSTNYLEVLEKSAPKNMTCYFIGLFENEALVGIVLSQFLDLNSLSSLGKRDPCMKNFVRNIVFKNFASHILFIGNNMLTGQNAFVISKKIDLISAVKTLKLAATELKSIFKTKGTKVHITTFKDFNATEAQNFEIPEFQKSYCFSTQPNMVFRIPEYWKSEQDYTDALLKKYRDQYKRARKKMDGIEKKKMLLEDIIEQEETIFKLYLHVAENAPFNTFFLAKNHFRVFKEILKDNFLFYGYFLDGKLIGFNTLIKNGNTLDTYFLGYDENMQREKMLYLNMLYDMVAFGVNKGFQSIVFARTALEIKSSVGAEPIPMYGFMEHDVKIFNKYLSTIFTYLEPKTIWQQRHPFKSLGDGDFHMPG